MTLLFLRASALFAMIGPAEKDVSRQSFICEKERSNTLLSRVKEMISLSKKMN